MIAPRRWWPIAAVTLGGLALLLHAFHLVIEFAGVWRWVENFVGVTTLMLLLAALTCGTLWVLGNMIDRKIVSVDKIAEIMYDAGWKDRDKLSDKHVDRPAQPPSLRLLRGAPDRDT